MATIRAALVTIAAGAVCIFADVAAAQAYPSKAIRVVTARPGGGSDLTSRLIAQGISGPMGQPVIVDNRGGIIQVEIVAQAPPDGYTLLVSASMWVTPLVQKSVSYDPIRDLEPVTLAVSAPNILVVHPSLPAHSVKDLIALAKARPGELDYGSGTIGSSSHIAAEKFKTMAGISIRQVPYRSAGPAVTALMGGETQLMFATAASVVPLIKTGRLRALGVSSAKPSALTPGIPTIAASGVPGYEAKTFYAVFAPAKTPAAIINRLNREIVRFLKRPEVGRKLLGLGVEVEATSPEEWGAMMKAEIASMRKIVEAAGVRTN
ncbi:MAG: tripartite tricarboxylate transporter substrate binding protein [Betaproteobacteria bacterium]|nr:tripartite tricarboxylate transporter substrate binding protein [Betaproteobacteria bacterium]